MSSWDDDDDDERTTGSDLESFVGDSGVVSAAAHGRRVEDLDPTNVGASAAASGSLKRAANNDEEAPNRMRQRTSEDDAVLRFQQELALLGASGARSLPTALQNSAIARVTDPTISSQPNLVQFNAGAPTPQQHGMYSHHLSGDAIASLAARGYPASMLGSEGARQNQNPLGGLRGIAEAYLLREQNIRNQQAALLLSQFGALPSDAALSIYGNQAQPSVAPDLLHQAMMQNQLQMAMQQQMPSLQQQQLQQLALQQSLGVDTSRFGTLNNNALETRSADLSSLLRQSRNNDAAEARQRSSAILPTDNSHPSAAVDAHPAQRNSPVTQPSSALRQESLALPPTFQGPLMHWSSRDFFPLGIDEDANWLSEFHCFVRSELVEVFRASPEDAQMRNGSISHLQIGMRCRYCAHQKAASRAGRSSAFPSSLRQIYQSFTMMLRDHFGDCDSIPTPLLDRFVMLKDKPAQGATDSKRYWIYSAMKIGMTDSSDGIHISEESRANAKTTPPFGSNPNKRWDDDTYATVALVLPSDRPLVTEFLYLLMRQVQPIRLLESECIGNRRSLQVGLAGFGCRFCCQQRRLGLCRMFPARRRTLPGKIADVYDHIRRCALTPPDVKQQLVLHYNNQKPGEDFYADQGTNKEFFDRVWSRLGHDRQSA